jgi:hypothetical protein
VADSPSTPPPEKAALPERGARSGTSAVDVRTTGRRRVKLSPASTAVVAAICAAAGVYLGAVVTGHYTTVAADSQIAAESKRTTTEFLREQQKTVYAAFIADEIELTRREDEFESLLFHAPVNSAPAVKETGATKGAVGTITTASNIEQLEQLRTQIPAIFDRVDKGNDSIQLIGSNATRTASQNVINLHFPRLMEILEGGPIINRPQSDFPELEELGESVPPLPNSPPSPMEEFLGAARKDLGAG